jgi:DNA-binding transcriptional regulator YdaS (Cro superfamily)
VTLEAYLSNTGTSPAEFAKTIGVYEFSVRRYMKGRVPTPQVMAEIIRVTNGEVTANDFFQIAA